MPKIISIIFLFLSAIFSLFTAHASSENLIKNTLKPQALLQLSVTEITETWLENNQVISVSFSHDLPKSEDYSRFVTVTENGISLEGQWIQSNNKKNLYLSNIKPENKYDIFIRPGIKSSNGLKLLSPKHFSITTTHPLPSVDFLDEGRVFSTDSFSSVKFINTNIKQQDVVVYHLNDDKQKDFIQKLQTDPDISNWNISDLSLFGPIVSEQHIELNNRKDQRITKEIKLTSNGEAPSAGIYFITSKAKTNADSEIKQLSYFILSDLALHVDNLAKHLEVFTVSRQNAKLIPNVKLKLITKKEVLKIKTDTNGFARLPYDNRSVAWLVTDYNKQLLLKKIPVSKLTYNGLSNDFAKIYLNKTSYKLGDKLEYSILLRDKKNKAIMDQNIHIALLDSSESIVAEQAMVTPELGNVSGFFLLPTEIEETEGEKGVWHLAVYLNRQDEEPISSTRFYLFKSNYTHANLKLESEESIFSGKQKIKMSVKSGIDHQGEPKKPTSTIMSQDLQWKQHPIEQYKSFSFGVPSDETLQSSHEIQTIYLDKNGESEFVLPKIKNKINSILSIKVQANMQAEQHTIASASKTLRYWPAEEMIGVRTLNWGSEDVAFGVSIEILNVNPENKLLASNDLELKLFQLSGKSNWEYKQELGWLKQESNIAPNLIEKRTLSLIENETKTIDFALDAGRYRVEVVNPETNLLTAHEFTIGKTIGDDLRPDQLKLSLNKAHYRQDETAILSIESAFSGEAIIRIASDIALYELKKINVSKGQTQIQIPLAKLLSKKQTIPRDLQLSIQAFHLDKGHYVTSKGKISLVIQQEKRVLSATLKATEKSINIHSNQYKNVWAVIALREVSELEDEQRESSSIKLIQTVFFDKEGNAIVNNSAAKIENDQKYKADLYFVDKAESDLAFTF